MITDIYNLDSEINRLLMSKKTIEDRKKFKEGIQEHIKRKQRDIATKMMKRIYNNDMKELSHDLERGEREKILLLIDRDTPVEINEQKKLLAILYPILKEELGDLRYADLFGL